MTLTGLDALAARGFDLLRGRKVALLCNPASVTRDLDHALDLMLAAGVSVTTVFGPQHGLVGSTQDNMIEWEGGRDPRTGTETPTTRRRLEVELNLPRGDELSQMVKQIAHDAQAAA